MHRFWLIALMISSGCPAATPPQIQDLIGSHCTDCHDQATKKGGLDLTALKFDLNDPKSFAMWVKVHDRVMEHEMPPKKKEQPEEAAREQFLKAIAGPLSATDEAKVKTEGRATWRRMNRYEYENTLRDLLGAPWLQVKDMLPEDGELYRFNKVGDALDISHIQIGRYLTAAEYALNEVLASSAPDQQPTVKRYYAREQASLSRKAKFSEFNRSPERATFPIVGDEADVAALTDDAAMTAGLKDPVRREQESVGVVASSYEPLDISFNQFKASTSGRYKIRLKAKSFWAGPDSDAKWWRPTQSKVSVGRTEEPVTLYSETRPRLLRKLGTFSVTPEVSVQELDVHLLKNETIRPDAVRLFRSRPPGNWKNPLAEKDGQPGVTFHWLEVEGPLDEPSLTEGRKLLFGDLPVKKEGKTGYAVVSANPAKDAEVLLRNFMARAYRRQIPSEELPRFLKLFNTAIEAKSTFTEALMATYAAVLCSPDFVTLEEKPGALDDAAIATRLSYFLHNSEPDAELRQTATEGILRKPQNLRKEADRLLASEHSDRFVSAFLDYWLDLRKVNNTSPDAVLYPDYYLDDYLVESSVDETRAFFTELIRKDLPASNLIDSDFAVVNEHLARHYGLGEVFAEARKKEKGVTRTDFIKVSIPADSPRGGLLTQASILKVTANGTTTSPVTRGVWIMERIMGKPVPPPPAAVAAVEPDTRGATTIREQLEKHRNQESCNVCHVKIDPAGFALESFDILGGWRGNYRALGEGKKIPGYGKNGQPFDFHDGPVIDSSGTLPGGGDFHDIRELKKLILKDERQVARNLVQQLVVYSTGAPVRFSDRPKVEAILDQSAASHYGVRTLIRNIVTSDLFLYK